MYEFIKIRIATHYTIYYSTPHNITTQSEELYRRLCPYRAKEELQRLKIKYGKNWGFDSPVCE